MDASILPELWLWVIVVTLVLYLVTDGFGLGVGILALFTGEEQQRGQLMASIKPVWRANQMWLALLGGMLFWAFPVACDLALTALRLPLVGLFLALTARGVGLEGHAHTGNSRRFSTLFGLGSLAAAMLLGAVLGAALPGLPDTPGAFDWLLGPSGPGAALGALILPCLTVALGSGWALGKLPGHQPPRALPWIAWAGLLLQAALASLLPLPALIGLPVALAALIYFVWLLLALNRGEGIFPAAACYTTACLAAWVMAARPLLTDPRLSPETAAASPQSLTVLLWGFGLALPVALAYSIHHYRVSRGPLPTGDTHDTP